VKPQRARPPFESRRGARVSSASSIAECVVSRARVGVRKYLCSDKRVCEII